MANKDTNDIQGYLGELFDRYHDKDLREKVWRIWDRQDKDKRVSKRSAKLADFYGDFYGDCDALTPCDFIALQRFIEDPEKRVLHIESKFAIERDMFNMLKAYLPEGVEISENLEWICVTQLKPEECYISTLGNSYFPTSEGDNTLKEICLEVYMISKSKRS